MPFITLPNRGLEVYYELHGDSKNPALVMINGLTRDHTAWKKMLADLSSKYHLLIFDNRGVGQTRDDGRSFSVDVMADDTVALIDALQLHQPFIAGHSLGGAVAQAMAKKYPFKIRKIALCNTFTKLNPEARQAFLNTLTVHQRNETQAEIVETLIPWVFSKSFVTPEVRKMIYDLSNANPHPQSAQDYKRQLDALYDFDSTAWIGSISIPTIVIGSIEDITATPDESKNIVTNIPGAKLEIIPGAHGSYTEQPVLLAEKLKTFF